MTDLYCYLLTLPSEKIAGKIYNAGYENYTVSQIAQMVKHAVGDQVKIITTPTNDHRSYHISSDKIKKELGFEPKHTIEEASYDLKREFEAGHIPDSLNSPKYFNVKLMQLIHLQ